MHKHRDLLPDTSDIDTVEEIRLPDSPWVSTDDDIDDQEETDEDTSDDDGDGTDGDDGRDGDDGDDSDDDDTDDEDEDGTSGSGKRKNEAKPEKRSNLRWGSRTWKLWASSLNRVAEASVRLGRENRPGGRLAASAEAGSRWPGNGVQG